jgi:hypothetical protein
MKKTSDGIIVEEGDPVWVLGKIENQQDEYTAFNFFAGPRNYLMLEDGTLVNYKVSESFSTKLICLKYALFCAEQLVRDLEKEIEIENMNNE